ncbi:MAG TPA: carbamoyltransferase HypF [Vicinamibacterales bacterium]|jgi:hydrogenase maturation protein HypF|nr:carbamoyltransferase HypF [Vicinamibacterales bacterium]
MAPALPFAVVLVRIFNFDDGNRAMTAPQAGRRIRMLGTVQGVGFRPWVYRVARDVAVTGRVRNDTAGVTIEAFGPASALEAFVDRLEHDGARPAAAVVDRLVAEPIAFEATSGFTIDPSTAGAELRVSIPPDLATCPECLAEVHDPANRRHDYPFTNCTNCGPRFTIVKAAPYDRPATTMEPFRMCAACQREYDSVDDRRFHAQPNACPACGPRLELRTAGGAAFKAEDVIAAAAMALREGRIVAVKGIGGFQLACDATSEAAVLRLRERKRRDEKPFAVMVGTPADARALAVLSEAEEALLTSVERPIVLAERREGAPLAEAVAPRNRLVGLLLANSPLHDLLLAAAGRPLVMTSGNLSEEPIACDNAEALDRLHDVADLFVLHDREIVTRCDDSIARVVAGRPVVLRRARGYVPRPIQLAAPVSQSILACGGQLKNTFCLLRGREAVMGPHIGDLDNADVFQAYRASIDRLSRFLEFTPEIVAYDLHPDYLSTRYALELSGVKAIGVQHHHAHLASVMAEHGLEGQVLGLAYDGTGYGLDDAAWGGEVLLAGPADFTRLATFRPLPLAGGDAAIREPWRLAFALVDDAFRGEAPIEAFPVFRRQSPVDLDVVTRMIRRDFNAPLAHGIGRYFDAFGALLLDRPKSHYEGQIALELNMAADPSERGRYEYQIAQRATPWEIDLRPAVRAAVFESIGGESVAKIAARIHNTIAAASVDVLRALSRQTGRLPVALSGGCFQNARLAESIVAGLEPEFRVYLHRRVPPGDGGIALGQALVAAAKARSL